MSDAGDFVDAALQREASWVRAGEHGSDGLRSYGSSVGAVRGAVRDAFRRYQGMDHDIILALSSELWVVPVFERRLAAVVVLQSNLALLQATDLTRIEGFLRQAGRRGLADPLALDVVGPFIDRLSPRESQRAAKVVDRWAADDDVWLRRAALLSGLRPLRAGGGDWDGFLRRARAATAPRLGRGAANVVVSEAVARVVEEMAVFRPELGPGPNRVES